MRHQRKKKQQLGRPGSGEAPNRGEGGGRTEGSGVQTIARGPKAVGSLGTRPSKNRNGGSGTSAGVEVYCARYEGTLPIDF